MLAQTCPMTTLTVVNVDAAGQPRAALRRRRWPMLGKIGAKSRNHHGRAGRSEGEETGSNPQPLTSVREARGVADDNVRHWSTSVSKRCRGPAPPYPPWVPYAAPHAAPRHRR